MLRSPSPLLTLDDARVLQRLLGADVGPGLSERELDDVEARFGFRFAADHRIFLAAGLPLGSPSWPDWRHGGPENLRARLSWPVDGVLFDVRMNGFWHPAWGPRPTETKDALHVARTALAGVPRLAPIYSHRYLPAAAGTWGHPVLSVHQTDIIYYGNDLADYIRNEFTGRPSTLPRARATVAFWSYIVDGCTERALTTPHDPYATTAREAVEYLRMLALERLIGRQVDDDQLIQAGLVASVLDVEAPSLPLLAALPQREYRQASALFDQVLSELDLVSGLPADDTRISWEIARWELVRWWLRLIVIGSMAPVAGAAVIAYDGWAALAEPPALRPLADLIRNRADQQTGQQSTPAELASAIVAEAERLLASAWPPHPG
ncbi:hypothetical protein [Yinghuangia seranimata]|uniref:hypothetical protein n=1 Tax=Yinghuangia seranimata TaxID=408067 RepID=UPI00248BE40E|nr:hypothetical protein [Yinghuangia seranimata]MDI2127615.1 hypothetical protein [Yinghuangia seranimata]